MNQSTSYLRPSLDSSILMEPLPEVNTPCDCSHHFYASQLNFIRRGQFPHPPVTIAVTSMHFSPVTSDSNVLLSTSQSPLSDLLILPNFTPKQKKAAVSKPAHICTSAESLEFLVLKEQKEQEKKKEEIGKIR